jgi:hypothetical protein
MQLLRPIQHCLLILSYFLLIPSTQLNMLHTELLVLLALPWSISLFVLLLIRNKSETLCPYRHSVNRLPCRFRTGEDNYSYKSKTRFHEKTMTTNNARCILADANLTFLPLHYLKRDFSRTHWLGWKVVPRIIIEKVVGEKFPMSLRWARKMQSSYRRSNTERREGELRWHASHNSFLYFFLSISSTLFWSHRSFHRKLKYKITVVWKLTYPTRMLRHEVSHSARSTIICLQHFPDGDRNLQMTYSCDKSHYCHCLLIRPDNEPHTEQTGIVVVT